MAKTTRCTRTDTTREAETQLHRINWTSHWLKKATLSTGSFFDSFDSGWSGSWGPWHWSALQTLGIPLLVIIRAVSLVSCSLSKALNTCSQLLTTNQMISLCTEHQKRNKENGQLKNCEHDIMTRKYHTEIHQNCRKSWVVAGRSTHTLKFSSYLSDRKSNW